MGNELAVEGQYQVVFTGLTVYGHEVPDVREKFRQQFKLSEEKARLLFSGQNIVVQSGLSWADAQKYQQSMKDLGALCEILPLEDDTGEQKPRPGYPCPECRDIQSGDTCTKCGFDIKAHRLGMKAKGFVDLPGAGFIKDRREGERRSGSDRRDDVRFEDGRRQRRDRRKTRGTWRNS